jgi:hypothetical protein
MSIAEFQRAFADLIASPDRCVALREGRTEVLADYDMTLRERSGSRRWCITRRCR